MRRHTRRTGAIRRLALMALVAALVATACSTDEPADADPLVDPAATSVADTDPLAAAHAAVVEYFAAFDDIVLTGDESHWTDRSSPDCFYCTTMAAFGASFGFGAGLQEGATALADFGLAGYEVVLLDAAQDDDGSFVVDVELELHLTDHVPVPPGIVGPDGELDAAQMGTGAGAGRHSARVTLTHDGGRWTVLDVTGIADPPDAGDARVDEAAAVLEHYLELERQVYLTGDSSEAERMVYEECTACAARLALARDTHALGAALTGGTSTVELQSRTPTEEAIGPGFDQRLYDDTFVVVTTVHQAEAVMSIDGVEKRQPATSYTLTAALGYDDGRWAVLQLAEGF